MTEPTFHALCAELLTAVDGKNCFIDGSSVEAIDHLTTIFDRIEIALVTPPPEPPTDEELLKLTENVSTKHLYAYKSLPSNWDFGDYCSSPQGLIDFARAVLERWGR